jgi:hypothetical protein
LLTISKLATDMKDKGFSEAWHDSWYSEDEEFRNLFRANMKQLAYDLTMFGVVGPMCASMMVAWDNDLDKEAKESNDLNDAVVASAAHMACKMVSSSFGDLNFIEAIGGPLTSW